MASGLLTSKGLERIQTALNKTNNLILNQPELNSLTGNHDNADYGIVSAQKILLKNNEKLKVIITLGECGCILIDKKTIVSIPIVKTANMDNVQPRNK